MTSPERRIALRQRYLSLGLGELVAAAVFGGFAAGSAGPRLGQHQPALWSALIPLLAILVQAGAYWLLARRWVGRAQMPEPLARLYRAFRIGNVALLVVGLVGLISWAPPQPLAIAVLVAVWLFGLAEFGNYYVVRLAYPVHRWFTQVGWWRRPRLVLDMTHRG